MTWIIIDILALLMVVLITGVLIPQILLIAFRKKLFDEPDARKIHTLPIPRLGGIAFLPAIVFTVLLTMGIGLVTAAPWFDSVSLEEITKVIFLGCGMFCMFIVGVADDLIGIRYIAKFIVQIFAALLLAFGGLIIFNLHGLFGLTTLPTIVAVLLTVLVIVFITNAINLIDGIDGLASGLSSMACIIYGYIFLVNGEHLFSLISFCTFGALISFFAFNVFGNAEKHKKIFMGDTGSLTIGIILSALAINLCSFDVLNISCPDTGRSVDSGVNAAVAAFAPLLVPCLDVVRVYMHRIRNHKSPFLPDKNHIHHKLLALGIKPRQAMPGIISFSLLLSIANILLSQYVSITVLFIADILLFAILNILISKLIDRKHN